MKDNPFNKIYSIDPERVPWGHKKFDLDLIYIIERLRVQPKTKVLDAGCGSGKNTVYLSEKGFRIYGFDVSEKAIAIARKRVPLGHFVVADASELPYKKNFFDVIVDVGLFHCIPIRQRTQVKNEISRILNSNGYFILREFLRSKQQPALKPLFYVNSDKIIITKKKDPLCQQFPVWGFDFQQIKRFFSRDFRIVNKFYYGGFILVLMSKK